MAYRRNMNWIRGNAYEIVVPIYDSTNTIRDITGWTFDFVVRAVHEGTILLALDTTDGIEVTDADAGEVTITVTAAQTEDLDAGKYVYALRRTNAGFEDSVTMGELVVEHSAAVPAP